MSTNLCRFWFSVWHDISDPRKRWTLDPMKLLVIMLYGVSYVIMKTMIYRMMPLVNEPCVAKAS